MGFISKNEINHFSFDDCQIVSFTKTDKGLKFVLEALVVCENNTQNSNYTRSYADETTMMLSDAKIEAITLAGYKVYDANDVLIEEVPDKLLSEDEWGQCLDRLSGMYLYRAIELDKSADRYLYEFEVEQFTVEPVEDLREDSYIIKVSFSESIFTWDKYLNRVQG